MAMTNERYDEIMHEAVLALKLDVMEYVESKYPDEAKEFESKLEELANSKEADDLDFE